MIHKSTKFIAVSGLVFFLACIALCVGFLLQVSAHKEAYAEKVVAQSEFTRRDEALEALIQRLDETEEERKNLLSRILPEEDVIDFLALVETLGKEQGALLTTSALTVQPLDGMFEYLVMNVDIKGTYDSVTHLITLFENLPYQGTVGRLEMRSDDNGEMWTAQFELRVTKFKKV